MMSGECWWPLRDHHWEKYIPHGTFVCALDAYMASYDTTTNAPALLVNVHQALDNLSCPVFSNNNSQDY